MKAHGIQFCFFRPALIAFRRSALMSNWSRGFASRHWLPPESETDELTGLADDTKAVSSRPKERAGEERPLTTPIYNSSTYALKSIDHYNKILTDVGCHIYVYYSMLYQ